MVANALIFVLWPAAGLVPVNTAGGDGGSVTGENFSLFFPGDRTVRSNWTAGVGQLLLGRNSSVLGGRVDGHKVCASPAVADQVNDGNVLVVAKNGLKTM